MRITWPNGLIQNETRQATGRGYTYQEAQRLSGSCPMIWTWNGRAVQFITDVLGVAPLGASDGEGTYFPVDHDEYVSIPGPALAPSGGHYEIRITEELSEVSYLDQVQLLAVDHPAGTEIFTNEKFKGPPYPEFDLFGVQRRVYPLAARDDQGRDVLPRLLARDQQYPDQFPRTELGVAAAAHAGAGFRQRGARWPRRAAAQRLGGLARWQHLPRGIRRKCKGGLVMPYLQMQDGAGQWETVNRGHGHARRQAEDHRRASCSFPSASRKLRIVTNLCVYWDEIFLSEGAVRAASAAERRSRCFPPICISADSRKPGSHPERKQPDTFFYDSRFVRLLSGIPRPACTRATATFANCCAMSTTGWSFMGSGDEIRLQFDASPRAASGRDGRAISCSKWTAGPRIATPTRHFRTSVEPLPFHAMSQLSVSRGRAFPG